MALQEKITQQDLMLYEILRHPVLCGEFISNLDREDWEEEFEYTDYQIDFLSDFNSHVSLSCARAVGKTLAISNLIVWLLINNVFKEDYIVYTVPNKSHLEPVFTNLVRMFRTNTLLKNYVEPKKGINAGTNTIKLVNNNATLICRIAGQTGDGRNVVGLHTPVVLLDEAGYYPWGTWLELQPILNTFTPGYKILTSGVPTGLREGNVLYHTDQENSSYTKHRISALQNPRFTEDDKQRAVEQYGGEGSDDYIHLVLGEHGKPIYSLFDRSLMKIDNYPVYKMEFNGIKMSDNISDYINKLNLFPAIPDKNYKVVLGIDLGYTEPTAIIIFYLDNYNRFKIHGRLTLTKVSYTLQEKIIDYIDTKFDPILLGIDEGSAGKAVIQRLQEAEEYIDKNYKQRLMPVNFSSQVVLGLDSEGNEIKQKTKPYSVNVLQEYANNHKLIFSNTDLEFISELERMIYSRTVTGDIVYRTLTDKGGKKGDDHFTSAALCGMLAYHLEEEKLNFKRKREKLVSARWLFGG